MLTTDRSTGGIGVGIFWEAGISGEDFRFGIWLISRPTFFGHACLRPSDEG